MSYCDALGQQIDADELSPPAGALPPVEQLDLDVLTIQRAIRDDGNLDGGERLRLMVLVLAMRDTILGEDE